MYVVLWVWRRYPETPKKKANPSVKTRYVNVCTMFHQCLVISLKSIILGWQLRLYFPTFDGQAFLVR